MIPEATRRAVERDLVRWERIRRYAVPRWMIERATERRLAGDWRGACAAAHVDVEIDEVAPGLEDDLRHLAPDLLRWHLPRTFHDTHTVANHTVVLGRYADGILHVVTPAWRDDPKRLRLRVAREVAEPWEDWSRLRHLWDARRAGDLLAHCGGVGRTPFLRPDGTPLGEGELPAGDPGAGDPVARSEWVSLLYQSGDLEAAAEIVGLAVAPWTRQPGSRSYWLPGMESLDLVTLAREAPAVAGGARRVRSSPVVSDCLVVERFDDGWKLWVIGKGAAPDAPLMPDACWRLPPDLDLLRAGRITPEELHPLVRAALCPERPPADGPVGPPEATTLPPLLIPCRGELHEVRWRDGRLDMPHPDEEQTREVAAQALGGPTTGCFAVAKMWRSGTGGPPELEAQREELSLRLEHGDVPGARRLLDLPTHKALPTWAFPPEKHG